MNTPNEKKLKSQTEAIQELLDANVLLMSVVDQMNERIKALENIVLPKGDD